MTGCHRLEIDWFEKLRHLMSETWKVQPWSDAPCRCDVQAGTQCNSHSYVGCLESSLTERTEV